jgi:hypothetical protein
MQNGSTFPAFNATTHDHYVSILASDGSWAGYPVAYVVTAGNIVISTFPESGYITTSDGKLWANFGIHAVAK